MHRSAARVLLFMVIIALSTANAAPQQAPSETPASISPEDMKVLLQRLQDLESQVTALKTQVKGLAEKSSNPPESGGVSPLPVPEQGTEHARRLARIRSIAHTLEKLEIRPGCYFVAMEILGGTPAI